MSSAAKPLSIHCSPTTTNPFPKPSKATPMMRICLMSLFFGKAFPVNDKIAIKIIPADTHLKPANNMGGIVSTPILIKR